MGDPIYHIGAKAIATRLGYRTPKMVPRLAKREGLPVHYRRVVRPNKRSGSAVAYAISEAAVLAWELAKGAKTVAALRAREAEQNKDKT